MNGKIAPAQFLRDKFSEVEEQFHVTDKENSKRAEERARALCVPVSERTVKLLMIANRIAPRTTLCGLYFPHIMRIVSG